MSQHGQLVPIRLALASALEVRYPLYKRGISAIRIFVRCCLKKALRNIQDGENSLEIKFVCGIFLESWDIRTHTAGYP